MPWAEMSVQVFVADAVIERALNEDRFEHAFGYLRSCIVPNNAVTREHADRVWLDVAEDQNLLPSDVIAYEEG